jgi:hypothetical protein
MRRCARRHCRGAASFPRLEKGFEPLARLDRGLVARAAEAAEQSRERSFGRRLLGRSELLEAKADRDQDRDRDQQLLQIHV